MDCPSEHGQMITEPLLRNRKGGIRTLPFILGTYYLYNTQTYLSNLMISMFSNYVMNFQFSDSERGIRESGKLRAASKPDNLFDKRGMVLLWLTTFPEARPPPCVQSSYNCKSATTLQLLLLYTAFCFLAIGAGGIRSSSLAFGADQLGTSNSLKHARIRESFFSWYYGIVAASVFLGMTFVVYIQDNIGWMVGFGVPVVLMILSSLSFFVASPSYVKSKPKASWITGLAQVVVGSIRNRRIKLSSQATDKVDYHTTGSMLLVPSEKLRFLNKACIIRNPQEDLTSDGKASDPWSLCTVDQVEDLKALIKASTMNRHITSKFEVPAASFPSIVVLVITTWVVLYDRIIIPLVSKVKGKIVCLNLKQRMGIGILLSTISMAALAIAESFRRETAIKEGFPDNPHAQLHISAMWLLPYFVLSGLAEAFNAIGQNEFFYTELPKSMSSVASTLQGLGLSAASLVSSSIVSAVRDFTKGEAQESWVSSNINKGHYDYYYWLLTILSLINFIYYLVCSLSYGPCREEKWFNR
ncbi:hypothetical protein NC651_038287 [Populus alba x Populus x berolinensis]|nr:hypothetical protein NC651_038287 [Populus alba x Populus x berolinensis]